MESIVTETITTSGTLSSIIYTASTAAILFGVAAFIFYMIKRIRMDDEIKESSTRDAQYLNGIYTAYKAGVVIKTAEEEGVTLIPRPAEPEKNIAATLKDQVKAEISQ